MLVANIVEKGENAGHIHLNHILICLQIFLVGMSCFCLAQHRITSKQAVCEIVMPQ